MAELPFHLKTIEPLPGALDILRFLGTVDAYTADADDICDTLDLSDRRFSKAIRRLVTKEYVVMDGDGVYRLTEQGQGAIVEIADYDAEMGNEPLVVESASPSAKAVSRRLIMTFPRTLAANQPHNVVVGFEEASSDQTLQEEAEMVMRFSIVNGQPDTPEDAVLNLPNSQVHHQFQVTPDAFTQVRLKVEVYQLDNFSGDISVAGGMYVDVDVNAGRSDDLIAYGTDITISA